MKSWWSEEFLSLYDCPKQYNNSLGYIVTDEGDYNLLTVDVPGMCKDDINLELKNGVLKIKGESKRGYKINQEFYIQKNVEKIEATVENGLLDIKLFKKTKDKIPIEFK